MTFWVAGAVVVSAGVGAAASSSAAGAQADAANSANQTQMAQYNQTRADQAPWRNRGNAAADRLNYLLGVGGTAGSTQYASAPVQKQWGSSTDDVGQAFRDMLGRDADETGHNYYNSQLAQGKTIDQIRAEIAASAEGQKYAQNNVPYEDQLKAYQDQQQFDPNGAQYGSLLRNFTASDFTADPGYDFRLSEGLKGVNNSAAARGGLLSGAALKAASKYNQNFASNEYSNAYNRFQTNQTNQFNRLASIAGVGQTATNQVAAAGQNMANTVSSNQLSAGNARASGYVGGANALTSSIGQGYNMYQGNQLMGMLANRNSLSGSGADTSYMGSAATAEAPSSITF